MAEPKPKKRTPYVNNKEFYAAMVSYRDSVHKADAEGVPRPYVPNYIGECIMKIATHLSYKPNFINYTFRDEMINDGIENCFQYIDNFNPDKSTNPFAYFTQIIYYAFIRRIQKEKKNLYIKYKLSENANIFGETSDRMDGDTNHYNDEIKYNEWTQEHMNEFITNFEEHKRRKRKKKEEVDAE
jgi:hypothetical protein